MVGMETPPPLIALCARTLTFSDEGKRDAFSSSQPYSRAVARAGGVPVLVPPIGVLARNAKSVLQHFDGVLLPGGGDVDPRRYGEEPDEDTVYGIVQAHDDLDIAIALAAIELDLPMLALCRGMQILNVALGGTLQQDIGNADHWMREHSVTLTEGSRIAAACGTNELEHCHSVHHQGLKDIAPALTPVGWAPDGQLEAVELDSASWIVGVQWHPEDTAGSDHANQGLFAALVDAARG